MDKISDCLSRSDAIADFEKCNRENPVWTPQRVKTLLMRVPSVDAVPVIRCRECIHRQGDEYPVCMLHTEPYANARGYKGGAVCVGMDDFCSFGKRREENNA